SDRQPFRRLHVKIKEEIIRLNDASIQPEQYTVKRLSPKQFKQWLDEGRAITLLDARNDYEVKVGTFEGAVTLEMSCFSQFPEAVSEFSEQCPEALKQQPVVTFCTGGVRCEKAGTVLEQQGFQQVYQLEGGILNYFAECGGAYWRGECFVF